MTLPVDFSSRLSQAWRATILCLLAGGVAAQTDPAAEASDLRFSGFGTLGILHSHAPAGWSFRRDIAQQPGGGATTADVDSRLGLQLNYAPNQRFELVGQALLMRRSQHAPASDGIEWAFAAYRPDDRTMLRAGRINLDSFVLSDYRSVGFAYRTVRPPVEYYGLLPTTLDGLDLARTWNHDDVRWRAKAYVGRAHSGDLSQDTRISLLPVLGAMVSREADGLLLRATITRTTVASKARALEPLFDGLQGLATLPLPGLAAQADDWRRRIDLDGGRLHYAALGATYELHDWQWGAEVTRIWGHPAANVVAGYAGVGYRFGPLTVFGGASRVRSREQALAAPGWGAAVAPLLGPALAAQVQVLADGAARAANWSVVNQRAVSLGVRWDLHAQLALKLQWDHIRIGANGSQLWGHGTAEAGHADIGSVVLDFVF